MVLGVCLIMLRDCEFLQQTAKEMGIPFLPANPNYAKGRYREGELLLGQISYILLIF